MTLQIAIVGTGAVARNNYLPYLSKQSDVSLSYFSRTAAKARECAERFGGRVAGSVAELMSGGPDAVLVLTGERQRYEATMELLAHKPRRLFFEKPLVARDGQASVREDDFLRGREILARARSAGTETAMVFNYRFFEQSVRARAIVAERGFGKLTLASLLVNYACWSHCIDLLRTFGAPATEISALAGSATGGGDAQAVDVAAAFRLEGGATGTIVGTGRTNFALSLYELQFCFENGTIRFSDLDGPMEVLAGFSRYRETHSLIGNHSRWDQYNASFEKALAAYLDSVRSGHPPPVPGVAGLEELQFEAALRRSAAQKRPVDVQREFPLEEEETGKEKKGGKG
jgi:predicted dehydrogenase